MTNYSFGHIHLISPDPVKTADFYEKMFAAKRVGMREQGGRTTVMLDLNGVPMSVSHPATEDAPLGLVHFGVRTNNIDKTVADMKASGVAFTQELREVRPGVRIAFITGPEGVSIELQEAPPG
ncbi:MAG: VOC family protein [Chloroflexi bacterium]|nr:VOC family protein [Chloroflexota bacterium]